MKETEQTLFLESNLLHIRLKEGDFEVINMEVLSESDCFNLPRLNSIEWPGKVELVWQIRASLGFEECSEELYDTFPDVSRRIVARLLPEEKKEYPSINYPKGNIDGSRVDAPLSHTESAYKEFEPHLPCVPKKKEPNLERLAGKLKPNYNHAQRIKPVESSETQENLTEALATFSRKFKESQQDIDPEISNAIQKGLWDLIGVSAPSESQEELWTKLQRYQQTLIARYYNNCLTEKEKIDLNKIIDELSDLLK